MTLKGVRAPNAKKAAVKKAGDSRGEPVTYAPGYKPLKDRLNMGKVRVADVAALVDPNMVLTEQAKLFVKYWAQGNSIHAAGHLAGYAEQTTYVYKLARFPQAIALYKEEQRLFEEANQMTRKKVMDGLLEGIEMAKLVSEPASVISGWKTIGQMCGYFEAIKRTVDININGNVTMQQMNKLSDAELLRVIQQGVQGDLERLEDHSSD